MASGGCLTSETLDIADGEESGAVYSCLRNAVRDQARFSWTSRGSFASAGPLMGFLRLVPAEGDVTGDIWVLGMLGCLDKRSTMAAFGAITKYWAPRRTQLPWVAGRSVVREHKIITRRLPC